MPKSRYSISERDNLGVGDVAIAPLLYDLWIFLLRDAYA